MGRYKTRKRAFPAHAIGFAWEIPSPKDNPGSLCSWARPSLEQLNDDPKPQTNAKPVRVVIMSFGEYLSLKRGARDAQTVCEQL